MEEYFDLTRLSLNQQKMIQSEWVFKKCPQKMKITAKSCKFSKCQILDPRKNDTFSGLFEREKCLTIVSAKGTGWKKTLFFLLIFRYYIVIFISKQERKSS